MTAPGTTALAVLRFSVDGERTLGHELVAPDAPILQALDLAATRGDGVFETISVGHGHPQALDAHLARFARSAGLLDLPAPDDAAWSAAVRAVAAELGNAPEGFVKTVLSRGVEGGAVPTGWAYAAVSPDHAGARTDGIRVVLLDRGFRHDAGHTAPWLLIGAKTLSYAINRAAVREAAKRSADDVVFVSTDGFLLEGPTANLVLLRDGTLVTPPLDAGILPGTTQADLFAWAPSHGLATAYEALQPQDLRGADAAWLVSSVRHAAPIRQVDHADLPVDRPLSDAMNDALRRRTR
jgi:4-amino-4-deoxychorismate lyase